MSMLASNYILMYSLTCKHVLARKVYDKWEMAKEPTEKPELTVRQFAAMGGKARAKSLTKAERKAIAQAGAKARWADKDVKKEE